MKSYTKLSKKIPFMLIAFFLLALEVFANTGWEKTIFGDIGGQKNINDKNFKLEKNNDGNIGMTVKGNKGKISGSTDGLMFYYTEIPTNQNFEISANVEIKNYNKNNQVSFGLMVRDEILMNKSQKSFVSDYIAAGPLNLKKEHGNYSFMRKNKKLKKIGTFSYNPLDGDKLNLKIKKSGDVYKLTVGDEKPIVIDSLKFTGKKLYIGTYVVRNAKVVFSNIKIKKDTNEVKSIAVDSSKLSKTEYLIGQELDATGLKVIATMKDGSKKTLAYEDYILTGFENKTPGKLNIAVNYNGVSEKFPVEVKPLSISKIDIKYYPAKTEYYKQDKFDSAGMVVIGNYNNGYKLVELNKDKYTLLINNTVVASGKPYLFEKSGTYTVKLKSNENSNVISEFNINVKKADLKYLKITNMPERIIYFKGDKLNPAGMAVYAVYSDGSKVRLLSDEYKIDELNSSNTGLKTLRVHYKNRYVNLTVKVKAKELKKVAITKYPKTTYYVGEKFNSKGMIVSKIYDNGDIEKINDFGMDTNNFNNTKPGEYVVKIKTSEGNIDLKTIVRNKKNYKWQTTIFGQSTKPNEKNFVKFKGEKIEIAALSGGGKITGDHDGITFYYTELDATKDNFVLSADIKVNSYGKKKYDGQESFGIMARDALGVNGDSAVSASNIAIVGGFSGGTKYKNGTQLVVRTGVTSQNGAGSKGLQKIMIKPERPNSKNTPYRLTLAKTNSGFTGKINDGKEVLIYEPSILKAQNGKMYVGFFTARVADIEVSNIKLTVSAAEADPAKIAKPKSPTVPSLAVTSIKRVSLSDYSLMLKTNVDGVLTVKEGNKTVAANVEIKAKKEVKFPTTVAKNKDTNFSIVFIPSDTQVLTSYKPILQNFTVEMKTYQEGRNIYVSPKGTINGDGSEAKPLDLDTAIDFVQPGQTIIVKAGRYLRNKSLFINKYNDGKENAMKKLIAEKGARPVIDFNRRSEGVIHSGNYWHIYGLDFTHSAPNKRGYVLGGNHNIIELCEFYENGDTGMQISRTDTTIKELSKWPSYNLIKNCTSYNNSDPSQNNADGFAAKLTVGVGNVFDGCISHHNADDGWDLYTKVGRGKIGPVLIKNCIVYKNGMLLDEKDGDGDGNGFKLGGEGLNVHHIIKNSVAFGNLADGFTSNSNPGIIAKDNISFNNKRNINFSSYTGVKLDFTIEGFKSYQYNNPLNPESDVIANTNKGVNNYFYNGKTSVNIKGRQLNLTKFTKFVAPKEIKRNSDGSIDFSFLEQLK